MKTTLPNSHFGKDHFHADKRRSAKNKRRAPLVCDVCQAGEEGLRYLPDLNNGYAQYECTSCGSIIDVDLYEE